MSLKNTQNVVLNIQLVKVLLHLDSSLYKGQTESRDLQLPGLEDHGSQGPEVSFHLENIQMTWVHAGPCGGCRRI